MIFIIRALSQWGKDDGDYDSPTSRDENPYENKRGQKMREGPNKKNKKNEKKEKGQCYYPFTTLVLQSSTTIFMIESLLCCNFHILVGIFHYRTLLVYSNDVLREDWKSLRKSKVWNNCLACHRGCAWWEHFVWRKWSMAKLYDFVGMSFLWLCYFEKTLLLG